MGIRTSNRRGRTFQPRRRAGVLAVAATAFFLLAALAVVLAGPTAAQGPPRETPSPTLAAFDLAWQTIDRTYVDPTFGGVDWKGVREEYRSRVEAAPDLEAAYAVIVEMVGLLQDGQTFVVPPSARAPQPDGAQEPELEYAGIGVIIQQLENGDVVVVHVFDGAPAQAAGVLVGDVIVSVDGWAPAEGDGIEAVSQHIRGPVDTPVELTVRDPDGAERAATVTRGRIDLRPTVEHRVLEGGTGYLRVPVLTDELVEEGARALPGLLQASGMVLDLRGVGAGSVAGAIRVAQWFLGAVDLGGVVTRTGVFPLPFVQEAIAAYNRPLVVLVGPTTSSLAEVLAMVLQEYGRATLVGQRTQGGFELTQTAELPGGGLLQVATGRYVSPEGKLLPLEGLTPEVEVPRPELKELREGRDPDLERALEVLRSP
ncbi:S41 family peptidase [Limnochorda pilosa]|uniref:PDZ domain-containing protein n=1 Tax=Limnochorda pilosa TaxID=1555112 RepID=A0A0K2SH60_LIMPI|nr:S41 family peptidase [Limnochorda pilosa]BAS26430.1 hypothetical protein LIP_0573 [Limnochorda pilosa]